MKEAESILGEVRRQEEHADHADGPDPVIHLILERLQLLGSLPELLERHDLGVEL